MRLHMHLFVPLALGWACSLSNADRCSEGRAWSPEYRGCLDPTLANDAGSTGGRSNVPQDSDAGGDAGQSTPDTFGADCTTSTDCTGPKATYCLLDPTNPTAAGMCTISNCTANDCVGTGTNCCDCTQSPLLGSVWLAPICVPESNVDTLKSIGCSCQ